MPNDYRGAISAYDQTNKSSLGNNSQEIEARALLKAADGLQQVKENWHDKNREELDDALALNKKLWSIFVAEMEKEDTGIPVEIRNNIANLGIYTFKRTLEVISDPTAEKLDILININRNIAAGLLQNSENQRKAQQLKNNDNNSNGEKNGPSQEQESPTSPSLPTSQTEKDTPKDRKDNGEQGSTSFNV